MQFENMGKQVLRDGQHFADTASNDIARALALVLNHGEVLFDPDLPDADMDFAEVTLWGEVDHG